MRLAITAVLVLTGCATLGTGQPYSEDEMMALAADLTKVSAAAEANLRYGAPSDALTDDGFLAQSVAHDPGLLKPFGAYTVKATRQGGHVTILVCSRDGTVAVLEDAGCTAALDRHRWKDDPPTPCAFSLDLAQVCSAP
jgi:hypothetical protein